MPMTPAEFKAIRLALGMTQPQLADLLGYAHTATVGQFETDAASKYHREVPPLLERLMRAYEAGYRPGLKMRHTATRSRKAPQSRS